MRYSGNTQAPQKDRPSLARRSASTARPSPAASASTPCELMYEVKPEYRRFVGLAGADENLALVNHGSNLAKYPSVVFKVFIDGKEAGASPIMRILSPAWRFDVPNPEGSKFITLVAMDAGDGNREDFADWANAGFVTSR